MVIENHLDQLINAKLRERTEQEKKERTPSGKLSFSILHWPTQWQVLKTLGVPGREFDDYVLGMFLRGKSVERDIGELLAGVVRNAQLKAEYRGAIGYLDFTWNHPDFGEIPLEVKSLKETEWRYVMRDGPKRKHKLQACAQALATEKDRFTILCVDAADLRRLQYTFETKEFKDEIDAIIDAYQEAIDSKVVPLFEPKEKSQANIKYSSYPDWAELTREEIDAKIKGFNGDRGHNE